jgi:SAM-dependent methyltransferase
MDISADGAASGVHTALEPSAWVVRWSALLRPSSRVLDLACGRGRHARFLAARGHDVLAVDRDAGALAMLAGVAGVRTERHDLEGAAWPLAGRAFEAVVVTHYLHRPLFEPLLAALADDGVLIYETFAVGNERFGRPSNPEFLLREGELLERVSGRLRVVAFEQGEVAAPGPAVVQRICAVGTQRGWPWTLEGARQS